MPPPPRTGFVTPAPPAPMRPPPPPEDPTIVSFTLSLSSSFAPDAATFAYEVGRLTGVAAMFIDAETSVDSFSVVVRISLCTAQAAAAVTARVAALSLDQVAAGFGSTVVAISEPLSIAASRPRPPPPERGEHGSAVVTLAVIVGALAAMLSMIAVVLLRRRRRHRPLFSASSTATGSPTANDERRRCHTLALSRREREAALAAARSLPVARSLPAEVRLMRPPGSGYAPARELEPGDGGDDDGAGVTPGGATGYRVAVGGVGGSGGGEIKLVESVRGSRRTKGSSFGRSSEQTKLAAETRHAPSPHTLPRRAPTKHL
eukprot:3006366-Prymnesium_polylepis.1